MYSLGEEKSMNRNTSLGKIFSGILAVLFTFSSGVYAEVAPIWNISNVVTEVDGAPVYGKTRKLTKDYTGDKVIIGGGSITGVANENTLIIDAANTTNTTSPIEVSASENAYYAGSNYVAGGAAYHTQADSNTLTVNKAAISNRTLFGGATFLDYVDYRHSTTTANGNVVTVTNSNVTAGTIDLGGGMELTMGGSVYGGYTDYSYGQANGNKVTVEGSHVDGDVVGGYTNVYVHMVSGIDTDPDTGELLVYVNPEASDNKVEIKNSTVDGTVSGAQGAQSSVGNSVLIDNSTVTDVRGALQGITLHDGSQGTSVFEGNEVTIQNNSTVGNVFAFNGGSALASNNSVTIDNSKTNGDEIITVVNALDRYGSAPGTPINANISGNKLTLSNISDTITTTEAGASLNFAGVASTNTVTFERVADFTVQRDPSGMAFDKNVSVQDLSDLKLFTVKSLSFDKKLAELSPESSFLYEPSTLNDDYGFIYGGAAFDYTSQTNEWVNTPNLEAEVPEVVIKGNGGTNSDNNKLTFTGGREYFQNPNDSKRQWYKVLGPSKVTGNIIGGLAAELIEINYATWAEGSEEEGGLVKTLVHKVGNVTISQQYKCDSAGNGCVAADEPSIVVDESKLDAVFSASNNEVVFEDTIIGENSVVYGGFVAGADLRQDHAVTENNTVVLRGNTQLESGAMVYGGNSTFGRPTNTLVFDHNMKVDADGKPIANEFVSFDKNQFANFNEVWTIKADADTRLALTGGTGVKAYIELDANPGTFGEGVQILQVDTNTDLTDVHQYDPDGDGIFDLTDTSVELLKPKKGFYSYTYKNGVVSGGSSGGTVGYDVTEEFDPNNVETYGQAPLAGVALASEGTEMLNQTFKEAWTSEADLNVFVNGGYHDTRYTTGSGFDLQSEIAQVGIWKKFQSNWLGGIFGKYGHGSYETFPIKAKGDVNAYALGLMTSYYYSETGRIEGTFEIGKIDATFNSDENALDTSLKTKGMYVGFLAGIVQDMSEDWELYANLQFLRKMKDDTKDTLDLSVNYDDLQTATLRFGTNYIFANLDWDGLTPSVGIMGLYEMLGKSDVNGNDGASLNGFSARAQARLTYHNESFFPIISELTAYGQVGKRRGWGGEANVSFLF